MSVSGGIKFFSKNKAWVREGGSAVASSNEDSSNLILDRNTYTRWVSIGSDDITTETIIITFTEDTIDRLHFIDMNWKQFQVKYWSGSAYVDFASVIGVNGVSTSAISETAWDKNTAYYEFTPVTTDKIQITIDKTQVVDAEKYLVFALITEEIGTFEGYPGVRSPKLDRNIRKEKMLSGRVLVQKSYETFKCKLNFKTHPKQNDITLVDTLHNREENFLVWLCGGRSGQTYFKIEQRGWRLQDIYNMQVTKSLLAEYDKNLYTSGVNKSLTLEEAV